MAQVPAMSEAERDAVSKAVGAAEEKSAGEIVTILTEISDSYHDVALFWSAAVAFLAIGALALAPDFYLGLIDRVTGEWETAWHPGKLMALALTVGVVKFITMWLLQLWRPLRLLLVPAPVKHARVRARAVTCFKVGAERRTHGRTGILIYLSLGEHRAEIVADEAIASKVAPEVWGDAMAAMLAHLRYNRIGDGLVAAVEKVGAVLAQHFPRAEDDKNELPDRLIEV
ncbi:TPM domain-containing protein [Novosphingobium sp.]|uniref:TPM domain-containing protein n=1 Tax=Novosphingobium sp. TaxID=1874826 RepID=UPI0035AF5A56